MRFDKTQRDFPTKAHRIPWHLGTGLLPFSDVIPESLSREESKSLASGEKSLHEFFSTLYSDMYRHPQTYSMEEIPDLYFNDGEWFKRRLDMTKVRNKNAHVMKALEILSEIGHQAALDSDTLILSADAYEAIIDKRRPKSVAKKRLDGFFGALRELGLEISEEHDSITIQSKAYPKIAIAASTVEALNQSNHDVHFHDLYDEMFDPILPCEEILKEAQLPPGIKLHCSEIARTEGKVIVHPSWRGQPPAFLKGWVDRVLRPEAAYEFLDGDAEEGVPTGLLQTQTAVVFNTSNTGSEREAEVFGDPLELFWKNCIFDLCGVERIYRKMFNIIVTSSTD